MGKAQSEPLNNVSFQLLLKMHNGDVNRATEAWRTICRLGRFGDIPTSYDGGLDIKGLRIFRDEFDQGGNPEFAKESRGSQHDDVPTPASADDIKRIEDIAAGDKPKV